jgi:uncharacterized protein (DUF427 family)
VRSIEKVIMIPEWARRARGGWRHSGLERPSFAISPGAGQESVWDYPRPPLLDDEPREVVVRAGDVLIGRSVRCLRVLETASPPTVYIPPGGRGLHPSGARIGQLAVRVEGGGALLDGRGPGRRLERVGWSYGAPFAEFAALKDFVSFYPGRLECYVQGTRVLPQPGGFYGGWITPEIVGPFKGEPGTEGW